MKYLEFTFNIQPGSETAEDVLSAVLADIGFDSFVRTGELERKALAHSPNPEAPDFEPAAAEGDFKAYIQEALFDKGQLEATLSGFPLPGVEISYTMTEAEDRDWNEEWEKNYFQPLTVDGRCVIYSTFHKDVPKAEYNIAINPQMSFGTGHHATTSQMISRLLHDDIKGKDVLDMGCGTGILAILARMRRAAACTAIDVDEWCVKNTRENIALNALDGISVQLGDASSLPQTPTFDLVIANINLGILLRDLPHYTAAMRPGADIYMSGFYTEDAPQLLAVAEPLGFKLADSHSLDGWACLKLTLA